MGSVSRVYELTGEKAWRSIKNGRVYRHCKVNLIQLIHLLNVETFDELVLDPNFKFRVESHVSDSGVKYEIKW